MWKLKKSILLAILSFILNTSSAKERIAYTKHWDFPAKSELFLDTTSYRASDEYHNLTYVLCDEYEDHKTERNCTVIQDTRPERSCPLTLQAVNSSVSTRDYLEVFPFNSTHTVIVWTDSHRSQFLKYIMLDMTTCGRDELLLMELNGNHSKIVSSTYFVAFDECFDIVLFFNNKPCRYFVNLKLNFVIEYFPWNISEPLSTIPHLSFRAIIADSKVKAYLHFGNRTINGTSFPMSLIHRDGYFTKLLAEIADTYTLARKAVSTAHETIGVAVPVGHRVDICLFDQEGELKLKTSIHDDIAVEHVKLRNLADGGFLLLTIGSNKTDTSGSIISDAYYWTRVAADGKVVGTVKRKFEPKWQRQGLSLQLFENKPKEYCAVFERDSFGEYEDQPNYKAARQLDLMVKCLSEEDFLQRNLV